MEQKEKSYEEQVAHTILAQLGGRRFLAMTGASNLVCSTDDNNQPGLAMKLPRNAGKVNCLKITLNGLDTYDMEFFRFSLSNKTGESKKTNVQRFENVYDDGLQSVFTTVTKMYTYL